MRFLGYSLGRAFSIGLIAFVFILLAKWALMKVRVPGLSAAAAAV